MRYLIDGCYGDGNVGDEALLRALCYLLRSADVKADIAVLTAQPEATAKLHSVGVVQRVNPVGLSIYGALFKGQLFRAVCAIAHADCFILGGGELFRDDVGLRAFLGMFYTTIIATCFGKRVLAFGVGAQKPSTVFGRLFLRVVFGCFDYVLFRDEESLALARSLNRRARTFDWCYDIVFALNTFNAVTVSTVKQERDDHSLRIAIAVKHVASHVMKPEELREILVVVVESLRAISRDTHLVVFVVAFAELDVVLGEQVVSQMRESGITVSPEFSCDIDKLWEVLRASDIVVAMPLHASVLSFIAGTPAVGIAYDRKVTRLYRQFDLEEYCLSSGSVTTASLGDAIRRVKASCVHLEQLITNRVMLMRQSILEMFAAGL